MRATTGIFLGALILVIGTAATASGAEAACAGNNVTFVNGTRNAMLQLQVREESSNIWIDVLNNKPLGVLRTMPPLCLPAGKSYEVRAVFQGGSNLDKKKQILRNNASYVVTQF